MFVGIHKRNKIIGIFKVYYDYCNIIINACFYSKQIKLNHEIYHPNLHEYFKILIIVIDKFRKIFLKKMFVLPVVR